MATRVEDENLTQIGREIVDDARRLVELEVALVRAEAENTLIRARNGILLTSAGFSIAFQGLTFWLLALAFALGLLQHPIGYFLVGSVFMLLAGLGVFLGLRYVRKAIAHTQGAVQEILGDVEWARQLPSRRANSSS